MARIRFKRGPKDRLPKIAPSGEPMYTTDTSELYIGAGKDKPLQKIGKQTKDINFICSRAEKGPKDLYIKFPYDGSIVNVDAYCASPGEDITEIDIEKISENNFNNSINNWTTILSSNIFIQPKQHINDKTYKLSNLKVNKNDLFRLNFKQNGELHKLTVQVQIELN